MRPHKILGLEPLYEFFLSIKGEFMFQISFSIAFPRLENTDYCWFRSNKNYYYFFGNGGTIYMLQRCM